MEEKKEGIGLSLSVFFPLSFFSTFSFLFLLFNQRT
jgi:hypothetical protein